MRLKKEKKYSLKVTEKAFMMTPNFNSKDLGKFHYYDDLAPFKS